jgi:hypothetical protein
MAKLGVALQLFGVREEMDKDAVGTLRAVAGLGTGRSSSSRTTAPTGYRPPS